MSRLQSLFDKKKKDILNVYCTAGFPGADDTRTVLRALEKNGADLIELGMPYSDPLADGPVIQASSARALQNGMTLTRLFNQLEGYREESSCPLVLMGYLNPLLQYGFDKFCARAAEVGVDGLIIPDMPIGSYEKEYRAVVERHGLDFIFLVTPETPEERVCRLDALSTGFLYAVSSSSITGSDQDFGAVEAYLKRLKGWKLKNPLLVGFGIRDRKTFLSACAWAEGAIIGTAYIRALEGEGSIEEKTKKFLQGILQEH